MLFKLKMHFPLTSVLTSPKMRNVDLTSILILNFQEKYRKHIVSLKHLQSVAERTMTVAFKVSRIGFFFFFFFFFAKFEEIY